MINEDIYKKALDESSETVFITDDTGKILYANHNAFLETGYPGFDGVEIDTVYPRIDFHENVDTEAFAYRSNGTCYPVRLTSKKLDQDGLTCVFAVDDTERKGAVDGHNMAVEESKAATKFKNEFTANITHELRTPINGIKGMAEGLEATELTLEQQEAVGIIIHCCDNMSKIVNDLLDYSKIEAGKMHIENNEFSLEKLIKDTLALHVGKINEKGIKLLVNISGPIPDRIISDELRLGQVLNNLLSNAVKFTSSGHIGLELTANRLPNGEIELFFLIIDTGIGISDDEKDKLFKSFSQVDGTITRRFGGTGLGLAITKQLIGLMGGTINVDSQKGEGSTFSFTVKVRDANAGASMSFPEGSFDYSKMLRGKPADHTKGADYGAFVSLRNNPDTKTGDPEQDDRTEWGKEPADDTEIRQQILEELEKLKICLGLGAWEKAEGFAQTIKNLSAQVGADLKKTAFSMLLNVRKENYTEAIRLAALMDELLTVED
ncbi:MAG: hypothetical protein K6G81_05245 [Lachnospiraceae bacterium]|nr:hypothetical protein [Lachnospiraceae bacterium]